MLNQALLTVSELTISYLGDQQNDPVFEQLNLNLQKNEILGLVGPSGSGKTTLVLCLLGLLPPVAEVSSGKVVFRGRNLLKLDEKTYKRIRGRDIGAVFQEPGAVLNPVMRIDKQLCEGMRWHFGFGRKEARKRAIKYLEEVEIQDPENCLLSYPHQLSGGMQQRVLIAAAISCQPKILICDEPTSALDVIIQNRVLQLLKRLKEKYDLSILLISHDIDIIDRIADRVVLLGTKK